MITSTYCTSNRTKNPSGHRLCCGRRSPAWLAAFSLLLVQIDEASRNKWLRYEVPKIRRTVAKHQTILYFQDESNISLTAFLGKTWGLRGRTPKTKVTQKKTLGSPPPPPLVATVSYFFASSTSESHQTR